MRNRADYRVGWICALPLELVAARTMLDERHPPLAVHDSDDNTYEFGRIGPHNVVLACLPSGDYRPSAATLVAEHMKKSFGTLRIGLLVGIGGGIPDSKNDIRLGDIVVSKPGHGHGGVIPIDHGKALPHGQFAITGSLNKPPKPLLTALSTLQSRAFAKAYTFTQYIVSIPIELSPRYAYPGAQHDRLFREDYDHKLGPNNEFCELCPKEEEVLRSIRTSTFPEVHYGTVGSGSSVISDVTIRKRLKDSKLGILCVETEAAGLMDNFPCIVIRGISDYADSHKAKNKTWYCYAALAAAALAKELLSIVPMTEISRVRPLAAPSPSETVLAIVQGPVLPRGVGLGWLVVNPFRPWDDCCPLQIGLTDAEVVEIQQGRVHELMDALPNKFVSQTLALIDEGVQKGAKEKTYFLLYSGNYFKKICGTEVVRTLCEMAVKYKGNVYMVVGLQVLQVPNTGASVGVSVTQCDGIDLQSGFVEGTVIAIQYRKVHVKISVSKSAEFEANLEVGSNQWVPFTIRTNENEQAVLEANLQNYISREDVKFAAESNIAMMDDQLVAFE